MKKWSEKYTEWMAILVSLMLLGISSLFSWDSNPIMGFDKLCADTVLSMEMTMGQAVSIILLGSMPPIVIACFLMRVKKDKNL